MACGAKGVSSTVAFPSVRIDAGFQRQRTPRFFVQHRAVQAAAALPLPPIR
jgi:hypothetical protein